MISVVLWLLVGYGGYCIGMNKIDGGHIQLEIKADQIHSIPVPFRRSFRAVTQFQDDSSLLEFTASKMGQQSIKQSLIRSQYKENVLQSLRSASLNQIIKMCVIRSNHLVLYSTIGVIYLVKQTQISFQIVSSVAISVYIDDQIVLQTISQQQALFCAGSICMSVSISGMQHFRKLKMPQNIKFELISPTSSNQFIGLSKQEGVSYYKIIDQKQIKCIRTFYDSENGFDYTARYMAMQYIVHSNCIYILSERDGIILVQWDNDKLLTATVVYTASGCSHFAANDKLDIVILCHIGTATTLQQLKFNRNNVLLSNSYLGFWDSYLTEVFISLQGYYFIHGSGKIISIWNTTAHALPHHNIEPKSQMAVKNLQTFRFIDNFNSSNHTSNYSIFYAVCSGWLHKYILKEQSPKIQLRTDSLGIKQLKLYIYGSCTELPLSFSLPTNLQTCRVQQTVTLKVKPKSTGVDNHIRISAFIITSFAFGFVVVIWVCLKKYKGLQNQARLVLQNYRRKKVARIRAI